MKKTNPILIQVAMKVECQELLNQMNNIIKKEIQGYQIYEGTIYNYPIIIILSKVGLIQTSIALTLAITNYQPIAIINMGIAGATAKELHTKDVIIGTSCININSYRTKSRKENEGCNPNEWELLTFLSGEEDRLIEQKSNSNLIELTKQIDQSDYNIYYGKIGSGDVWNQEIDRLIHLNKKYNILCEDMEAIAAYTIGNQWNIPVISIKMISDNSLIGEEYNRNVGLEIQKYILKYLEKLINSIINNFL